MYLLQRVLMLPCGLSLEMLPAHKSEGLLKAPPLHRPRPTCLELRLLSHGRRRVQPLRHQVPEADALLERCNIALEYKLLLRHVHGLRPLMSIAQFDHYGPRAISIVTRPCSCGFKPVRAGNYSDERPFPNNDGKAMAAADLRMDSVQCTGCCGGLSFILDCLWI